VEHRRIESNGERTKGSKQKSAVQHNLARASGSTSEL